MRFPPVGPEFCWTGPVTNNSRLKPKRLLYEIVPVQQPVERNLTLVSFAGMMASVLLSDQITRAMKRKPPQLHPPEKTKKTE